jgi:hypothetical protein
MWGDDHRLPAHTRAETPIAPAPDEDSIWEAATPSRYGRRPVD